MVIQTEYLATGNKTRIRRFTRADVDRWQEWPRHSDPLFDSYNPPSMSAGMRDAWFDDLVGRQAQLPFAVDDLDGTLIGRIFLRHRHRPEGSATLGIDLRPEFLNHGYGTDALTTFMEHFFCAIEFDRMYLAVAIFNGRAMHLYERLGFRKVNEYWDRLRTSAKVMTAPRYEPMRHLFRNGDQGLEALHQVMVVNRTIFERLMDDRKSKPPR
ncbi:MAG: GNAT family N-acetyltransferase [Chloroflexota bacterium]